MAYQNGSHYSYYQAFLYFIGVLVMLLSATTFSQMLAICTPNEGVGNVVYTTFCTLCRMFGGFLIKISAMKTWCVVINGFNFFKYALFYFAGTLLVEWDGKARNGPSDKNGKEIFEDFRVSQIMPAQNVSNPFIYLCGLILFLIVFHFIALITLTFKRWDKR